VIFISAIFRLSLFKLFFGGAMCDINTNLLLTICFGGYSCRSPVVHVPILHDACHLLEEQSVFTFYLGEASLHELLFFEVSRKAARPFILD
jgi:hypothetical protein